MCPYETPHHDAPVLRAADGNGSESPPETKTHGGGGDATASSDETTGTPISSDSPEESKTHSGGG